MAGQHRYDDPVWADVSAFLAELEAAYPPDPEVRGSEAHFAAIAQETRRVRTRAAARPARHRPPGRSRLQLLAAWVIATLLAATAAVGIAGASGRGPLARLWHPSPVDTMPVPSARPAPGPEQQPPANGGSATSGSPVGRADNRPKASEVDSGRSGRVDELRPPGRTRGYLDGKSTGKPGKGLPGVPGNDPTRPAGGPDKPGKGLPGVPGNDPTTSAERPDKPARGRPGDAGKGEARAAADRSGKAGRGRPDTPGNERSADRSSGQG